MGTACFVARDRLLMMAADLEMGSRGHRVRYPPWSENHTSARSKTYRGAVKD